MKELLSCGVWWLLAASSASASRKAGLLARFSIFVRCPSGRFARQSMTLAEMSLAAFFQDFEMLTQRTVLFVFQG
ncbi:hypothetical protein [Microbulbifer sp. 2205BS26-8]|uniref:hypothetical protein n=1 Tax=Microbulbifer sp. 2205BS26-8 TaxID=3064386 RepID=UPI00273DE0C8|nr:hypothetical protein [Microbulbifer sp. 2205BS26-8]MDP5208671.1 hypothetical protein [Microbulbifer sp. 2205BS26-8]